MEFRILGPLEVVGDGGELVPLRGGKGRALLAVLLLNLNRTVAVTRLIDDLWGDDVPDSATKAVQIYVSQLRKALPEGLLHTRPPGYLLELALDGVDLYRFERLVAEGRASLAGGDPEHASRQLTEALALWRGAALAEFPEPFAQVESARLEELRLSALEERIEADLARGRHAELAGELDTLLRRHPLRERLHAQQMLTLYRAGRQAEALACYQDFRRALDEELGIEPSPRLRELERRMLQQDPELELEKAAVPRGPTATERPATTELTPPAARLVGRDVELGRLGRMLEEALTSRRQVVFVPGEAGIGKTALVQAFLGGLTERGILVARAQCHAGQAGEPYAPLLDAFEGLARGPEGRQTVAVLAERAPSWLLQLPWLVPDDELGVLEQRARGTTRERMLRELAEAVETLSLRHPLVLVLEDLHVADHPTIDLLALIAGRPEAARLLLLGTYRPEEARATRHPVPALVDRLALAGLGHELALPPLSSDAAEAILSTRLRAAELPDGLSSLLAERARGNPLFMASLVESWLAEGAISVNGGVRLAVPLETLASSIPRTLRALVEGRLSALAAEDRDLLEAASVAGTEFAPAAVAAALELPEREVQERLTVVARLGLLIEPREVVEWPDGTVAGGFGFANDLYQQVLYELVPAARRILAHRRIGERLEDAYGDKAPEIGGQLAFHFLRGREPGRALDYLRVVAERAFQRNAYAETIDHVRQALDVLATLPASRDHDRLELELQSLLGQALVGVEGWSAPGSEEAFVRARTLGEGLHDNEPLAPVLLALGTIYEVRGEFGRAEECAQAFLRQVPDAAPRRRLEVAELLACSLFHQGSFAHALEQAQRGVALFAGEEGHYDTFPATLGDNAGISCHAWSALALWFLGYPDQALERAREAVELAGDPQRSYSLAPARAQLAILHQCRLEPEATAEWAEATIAAAGDRGYAYRIAMGRILRGWALAASGQFDEGIRELERGLLASRATGAHMDDAYYLGLLADARMRAGRVEAGLAAVEEALEIAHRERSFFCEAELVRLRGELLLATGGEAGETEACFRQALELARGQSARSLELRIANCLTILRGDAEARSLLARVHGAFTEGFETPDLSRAAELLADAANRVAAAEDVPPASPVLSPAKAATAGDLLERDEALAVLVEAREAAARGEGRVVVVTGEPGIGKTSLVTRFVRGLEPGARVLFGTCDDLMIPRPLGPLRDLVGTVSAEVEEALFTGAAPHEIQRLLIAELKLPPAPSVLVLEDMHWADDATLDSIAVLVRRIGSLPALLVLTFRAGEVPPAHPLHATVGAIRAGDSVLLELAPLSEAAVASLAGDDAGEVYAATGGNPFYVTELLASRTAAELPPSVANAVLGRASRLDDAARRLVELVSVVPNRVSTSLLDSVMPGWAGAAVEPERRRLLEIDPTHVRFRHELARHALRSSLPVAARRRLHAEILEALLETNADPSDIVHHAEAAGAEDVVAEYALVAARRAAALESNREAYSHYRRVSDFVERLPEPDRATVLEELAIAAYLVGLLENALPAIERAIAIYRDLDDELAVGRCTRVMSRFHWYAGEGGLGRAKAVEAIAILEPLGESVELARAYSGLAQLLMLADDLEQALALGDRALELAVRLGDESTRARALVNIGSARILQDHRETAALLEAHAIADAAGEREEAMRALGNLGYTLMCWVQPEPALRFLQQSLAYAQEHEVHNLAPYFALNVAWLRLRAGEWDEAEGAIRVEIERGSAAVEVVARIVLTELAIRRGDPDASERLAGVTAQADRAEDLQRMGQVLELAAEWALTSGARMPTERFEKIVDEIRPRGTLSGCRATRVAAWAAVAGIEVDLDQPTSPVHAAMLRGDWAGAADAFGEVGWTYDRALMLSLLDDQASLHEAIEIARGLGAEPLRTRIEARMRELGLVART